MSNVTPSCFHFRLISFVAYKNVIDARRASWRIVSFIEQKEESRGNEDHVAIIHDYRTKIKSELSTICGGILKLLDSRLIPSASAKDSKVFYLKMKGDYHRYLAEFMTGAEHKEAVERHSHRRVGSNSSDPTRFGTQFLCFLVRDSQLSRSRL
ncbi:hypothetical protein V6N13_001962 [Hibiscus sabdariffa]